MSVSVLAQCLCLFLSCLCSLVCALWRLSCISCLHFFLHTQLSTHTYAFTLTLHTCTPSPHTRFTHACTYTLIRTCTLAFTHAHCSHTLYSLTHAFTLALTHAHSTHNYTYIHIGCAPASIFTETIQLSRKMQLFFLMRVPLDFAALSQREPQAAAYIQVRKGHVTEKGWKQPSRSY